MITAEVEDDGELRAKAELSYLILVRGVII